MTINGHPVLAPPITDAERLEIFQQFLRETPRGLLGDRANAPDHFPSRPRFEAWRARWLPYLAGMAERPTSAEEYAALRWRLFSGDRPDIDSIDRFHS